MGLLILLDSRGTVEDVHQNSRSIQFNYLHQWGIFMHSVSKLLIIIHIIHLNIKECIVTKSGGEPATILNHVEGSRNQVEVTSKICVANSGIRNQTSTIIPVKYYHVICKSLLKLAIRITGIKSGIKKSSKILQDSESRQQELIVVGTSIVKYQHYSI